jgi:uncharacterized protein YegP (UPF0339 family)
MTKQTPRFEVVHTGPAKFHARFIGGNGEPVWTTESYTRKAAAVRAIEVITDEFIYWDQDGCHIPPRPRATPTPYTSPTWPAPTSATASPTPARTSLASSAAPTGYPRPPVLQRPTPPSP